MASRTPRDIRLALGALAATVLLGLILVAGLGKGLYLPIPFAAQVDLHAGWALLGWAGILLGATSWVVVPMFHITPPYPTALTRHWAPGLVLLLLAWSGCVAAGLDVARTALGLTLLVAAAAFVGMTLRLQARTRRSKPDASFRAFRLAMFALLAGITSLVVAQVSEANAWPVLAGILILHGGLGGATSAMLYKIVPFLAWLNLTQSSVKAPNVKKLMPEPRVQAQLNMHSATLAALVVAALVTPLAPLAGIMVVIESAWLLRNLVGAVQMWRAHAPVAA